MTKDDGKAIARLIAFAITKDYKDAEELLDWAYYEEPRLDQKPPEKDYKSSVEIIYSLYPTTDRNNNNRSLGKGEKAKRKILSLLKSGKETEESLKKKINGYVSSCRENGAWMTNFDTFLNNLPTDDPGSLFGDMPKKSIYQ